jgi:hypothetical protein
LTWVDASSDETGFKIYQNGSLIATVATPGLQTYAITGLTPGLDYSFYVKAYNAYGDSTASNTATFTTGLTIAGKKIRLRTNTDVSVTTAVTIDDATDVSFNRHILPITDNTSDVGSSTAEIKNVYVDGVAYVDELQMQDSEKIRLGTGQDVDMYYDGTNMYLETDKVAASDLKLDCGTDKTIELVETVWDDMRIVPGNFDRAGITDPTIVAYAPNGGAISTYLYEFQLNDIAYFTAGPRGNEENGKTVGWKLDYTWANINGNFGSMATLDLSDACDGTDHKHQMTPDVSITGTNMGISSMLICNIKRTDTGTDDTWVGTASGELPMLLEIDFHYEIDTLGSRQISTK